MRTRRASAAWAVWLTAYATAIHAYAQTSFAQEMYAFDWRSLVWAAVVGLGGGIGRLILWLASEDTVVVKFWRQLLVDVIVASFGGVAAWGLATYLATVWPAVFTKELRFVCIVAAGASRGRWQDWVGDACTAGMVRLRRQISGGPKEAPPDDRDGPSTVSIPLTTDHYK